MRKVTTKIISDEHKSLAVGILQCGQCLQPYDDMVEIDLAWDIFGPIQQLWLCQSCLEKALELIKEQK